MQDGVRVHAYHGVDETIDEVLILESPNPLVSHAEVHRVVRPGSTPTVEDVRRRC